MHSFTFSSNIRIPSKGIRNTFLIGVLAASIVTILIETGLRIHGMHPRIHDRKELWAAQRTRASVLGDNAVILVGASRIQLGTDLDILGDELNLTPVQLAIGGTSFVPVLEDLVADSKITGTIIVSTTSGAIRKPDQRYKSTEWVEFYVNKYRGLLSPAVEQLLKSKLQSWSAIYSSGLPMPILLKRALGLVPVPQLYMTTRTNREWDADYTLVHQPAFYLTRATKHLGKEVNMEGVTTLTQAENKIRSYFKMQKRPIKRHKKDYAYINNLTKKLQSRGAKVVFVRFPTSGLIWEMDNSRGSKEYNWDQFAYYSTAPTVHFMDYPELQYPLADGSHLDVRQKAEFTKSLAEIVKTKLGHTKQVQSKEYL